MRHSHFDRNFILIQHLVQASVVLLKIYTIRTSLSSLPREMFNTLGLVTFGKCSQNIGAISCPTTSGRISRIECTIRKAARSRRVWGLNTRRLLQYG